jgi:hypothetical protein
MSQLIVPIEVKHFSAVNSKLSDENALAVELSAAAGAVQFREIRGSQDLILLSSGKTVAGLRYGVQALRQLCTLLCRGLSLAVLDLSGFLTEHPSDRKANLDEQFAVEVLNKILRLRGREVLRGRRLVIDSRTAIVHGVVGSRYHPFSNHELYERAKGALAENADFHEASLHGLSLVLRFRVRDPFFIDEQGSRPETYYSGWSLRNSEVGTRAVQGAVVLFKKRFDRKVVDRYGSSNLPHVGSESFVARFGELLLELRSRRPDVEILRQRLRELRGTSLGLGVDRPRHEQRVRWMARRLFGRSALPHWMAKKAVQRVLTHTASGPKEYIVGTDRYADWETRTHYDLLDSVLAVSKERLPEEQEAVLNFGYRVLNGDQKLI